MTGDSLNLERAAYAAADAERRELRARLPELALRRAPVGRRWSHNLNFDGGREP